MEHDLSVGKDEVLRRHAAKLRERAREAYGRSRHTASAETWAELERIERSLDNEEGLAEARFWHGTALHGHGRLREALLVFGRSLEETALGGCSRAFRASTSPSTPSCCAPCTRTGTWPARASPRACA